MLLMLGGAGGLSEHGNAESKFREYGGLIMCGNNIILRKLKLYINRIQSRQTISFEVVPAMSAPWPKASHSRVHCRVCLKRLDRLPSPLVQSGLPFHDD